MVLLQFNPQLGDIAHNLKRAETIISQAETQDIDLLVLPEMAFSGTIICPCDGCNSFLSAVPTFFPFTSLVKIFLYLSLSTLTLIN